MPWVRAVLDLADVIEFKSFGDPAPEEFVPDPVDTTHFASANVHLNIAIIVSGAALVAPARRVHEL
jgi:hypothetical protein